MIQKKSNLKAKCGTIRTRQNEGIPVPIQPTGRREVHMRQRRSNNGSSTIPLYKD